MKLVQFRQYGVITAAFLALSACGGGSSTTPTNIASSRTALELATELLQNYDASIASSIPTTGAAFYSLRDACSLTNGGTKAFWIQDFDDNDDSHQANAYRIGSTRSGITVLAERTSTNINGTGRREIDIKYDINYVDGSSSFDNKETLIVGSSSGSCATSQDAPTARFFGNRQLVEVGVTARNVRNENYILSTGSASSTPVTYRREVLFNVADPMGNADYVVVTGRGTSTVNSVTQNNLSMLLLSPKIIRDNALMAGKEGHYSTLEDNFGFVSCLRAANTGTIQAHLADCIQYGTGGNGWGINYTPGGTFTATQSDTNFDNINFAANEVYTFKVYKDDGWKTPNGFSTRTPIATYTATLKKLPYTFVEMSGTSVSADLFPKISSTTSHANIAAAFKNGTSLTVPITWSGHGALSDTDLFKANQARSYYSGPASSNSIGVTWPKAEVYSYSYLLNNPSSTSVDISSRSAILSNTIFGDISINMVNRNGSVIRSRLIYQ